MRILNSLAMLGLAVFAAFSGLFFIGSKDEHDRLLTENFWGILGLRLYVALVIGLVGAAVWWLLNICLLKSGLVKEIALGNLACLLSAAVVVGALIGALLFCFL